MIITIYGIMSLRVNVHTIRKYAGGQRRAGFYFHELSTFIPPVIHYEATEQRSQWYAACQRSKQRKIPQHRTNIGWAELSAGTGANSLEIVIPGS